MANIDCRAVKNRLERVELNRIKSVLRQRGVSQRWVATQLNKTNNTLNCWCANRVQPHLSDLFLLAVLLDCDVPELIAPVDRSMLVVHHEP